MSDQSLDQKLTSVFSLLPRDKAAEAKRQLLRRYKSSGPATAEDVIWAEFNPRGRFLRGGYSSVTEKSTSLVSNSQEIPKLDELARHARSDNVEAGSMFWDRDSDRLYWFVPVTPSSMQSVDKLRLRGFSISQPVFSELVHTFNPQSGISPGEMRAAFQIVGNASLREAADADHVAYETKRAHSKSLCSKLQCAGQRELVTKIIGQMVHLLSITDGEASHSELLESFVARYLSNDVALKMQRLPNGRLMRVLEAGPADGQEVVMIHGIMFPISLFGISEFLEANGIRLIVPIREGFFESRPMSSFFSQGDPIQPSLEDIALFLQEYCEAPARIIGNSLGAVVAVRFANHYPSLVKKLVLLGTNLKQPEPARDYVVGEFYSAMRDLSSDAEMFKMVSWQFKQYYADERVCMAILRNLFGESATDIEVLDGVHSNGPGYRMFSETYQQSLLGVSEDLGMVMRHPHTEFESLRMPVTFVQGSDDPLTKPSQLRDITTENSGQTMLEVPGAGHFLSVSHGAKVWKAVRAAFEF